MDATSSLHKENMNRIEMTSEGTVQFSAADSAPPIQHRRLSAADSAPPIQRRPIQHRPIQRQPIQRTGRFSTGRFRSSQSATGYLGFKPTYIKFLGPRVPPATTMVYWGFKPIANCKNTIIEAGAESAVAELAGAESAGAESAVAELADAESAVAESASAALNCPIPTSEDAF
ncbi:Hypothetical protein FKW44_022979 [Caligus rogercresseyi]|uniref:Uncharacterized protein n=1 Tax=Caligus rogercresseyi TaxID=217165 RepID=A0A7T8GNA4_CALRO|nr:Hypothetical protein FKW44_022979 [Caligus rogercresseyi]